MRYLKFLSLGVGFLFVLSSCTKEDTTELVDNTPTVQVETEEVSDTYLRVHNAAIVFNTAEITVIRDKETKGIINYSLILDADGTSLPTGVFSAGWFPKTAAETGLSNGDYTPDMEAATISSEDEIAEKLKEWSDNGSKPDEIPDLSPYITLFEGEDAENMVISISNPTASGVEVELSGYLTDANDTDMKVEAAFTATLKEEFQ